MGYRIWILLYVETINSKSKTGDVSGEPKCFISRSYFLSKCFVAGALSMSHFGHVTVSGEWLSPTLCFAHTVPNIHHRFCMFLPFILSPNPFLYSPENNYVVSSSLLLLAFAPVPRCSHQICPVIVPILTPHLDISSFTLHAYTLSIEHPTWFDRPAQHVSFGFCRSSTAGLVLVPARALRSTGCVSRRVWTWNFVVWGLILPMSQS